MVGEESLGSRDWEREPLAAPPPPRLNPPKSAIMSLSLLLILLPLGADALPSNPTPATPLIDLLLAARLSELAARLRLGEAG